MAKMFVKSLTVIAAVVSVALASKDSDPPISVDINQKTGGFQLMVGSKLWYNSGEISYTTGGVTKTTTDGSLVQSGSSSTRGQDTIGAYTATSLEWDGGNFVTTFRQYSDAIVFEQSFPNGVNGTCTGPSDPMKVRDDVSTSFPYLIPAMADKVGYLAFARDMVGSGYEYGTLGGNATAETKDSSGMCRITAKNVPVTKSGGGYSAWTRDANGDNFTEHHGDYCDCSGEKASEGCSQWVWHGMQPSVAMCQAQCEQTKCDCFDFDEGGGGNAGGLPSGVSGFGPLGVFSQDLSDSIVISSFSQFMAASGASSGNNMAYGLQASVTSVQPGYSLSFIVAKSTNGGVNEAFEEWGDKLLATYEKSREMTYRDYSLNYLGYSTDNGAFYYYQTEDHEAKRGPPYTPGKTYEQTLIDVKAYADSEGIPYKYVLLDSWWYYQGMSSGVKNWIGRPDIFPHGNDFLRNKTGWPIMGHNRFWAIDNVYATQNGGDYDFVVEKKSENPQYNNYAWPMEQRFWNDLLYNSSKWGLFMYEQDWLDTEYDNVVHLNTDANAARTWLRQMGTAAATNDLTIQYCMSHCRHILQSVEIPAVTNARASGDYHPGGDQWKAIGTTGIFAWAVAIAPSKDNYWSTDHQNGSAYSDHATIAEPYNRLQAAVSTLSKGPVAPSDKIGSSNTELIFRSCASDGKLLQGDKPAMVLNALHVERAFSTTRTNAVRTPLQDPHDPEQIKARLSEGLTDNNDGEIWTTHTTLDSYTFAVMLAANIDEDRTVSFADLGMVGPSVAFEANTTDALKSVMSGDSIAIKACGKWDFQHWALAPVFANGLALVGEQNKWVPVSNARFSNLKWYGTSGSDVGAAVDASGPQGETIQVSWAQSGNAKPIVVECTIPQGDSARISIDIKGGKVMTTCGTV